MTVVLSLLMKVMTCAQLGGPCEFAHRGTDHNEIIHAHDRHLRDAVAAGSTEHEPPLKDMKARWRRPVSGLKWYRRVERDFAALPVEG
jgi:predicted small metal-binding protein